MEQVVTGVKPVCSAEEFKEKMAKLVRQDFDFFCDGDVKPFSNRIMAENENVSAEANKKFRSFDGIVTEYGKKYASSLYVKNGLVLPDGMIAIDVDVPVKGAYLDKDTTKVTLVAQGKVPGVFRVYSDAKHIDGVDASTEYVVFLDGNKVCKSLGIEKETAEKGVLDDKGKLIITESKVRPEIAKEVKEEVKEVKKEEPKVPRKSVQEQNIEAGFPDKIADLGTGFNRIYMRAFAGDFKRLDHTSLFPRDVNKACPVLADPKLNLGEMNVIAITITPKGNKNDVAVHYGLGVMELNLERWDDMHTAYGPALTKDVNPGHPKDGSVYYMDITGMSKKDLKKLEKRIDEITAENNAIKGDKPELSDVLVRECLNCGAKSPILVLGKAFDNLVHVYEQEEQQAIEQAKIRAVKEDEEIALQNQAIKDEVKAKKRAGEYIEKEHREQIFVHKPVIVRPEYGQPYTVSILEPPDKEKGENYFKINFKSGYQDMQIRIPKASKRLGKDGLPLTYVKTVRDKFSDVSYVINVSHKEGKHQFPAYSFDSKKGWVEIGTPIGYSELYSFMEIKNQELRQLEEKNLDREISRDEARQKNYRDYSREQRGSLKPGRSRFNRKYDNSGYGDGM